MIALLIFGWEFASVHYKFGLIPSPVEVLQQIYLILRSSFFYDNLQITLLRVLISLILSLVFGITFGLVAYINKSFASVIGQLNSIVMLIPQTVIVFIIIIILSQFNYISPIVAVFICLSPNTLSIFLTGIKSINTDLIKMGKVYKIGLFSEYKDIVIPGIYPFIIASVRTGLSISWRATMLAEMFSFNKGVGYQIYYQFQLFSLTGVLAWTIAFLIFVSMVEWGLNLILVKLQR